MLASKHAWGKKGECVVGSGGFGFLGDSAHGVNSVPPADWYCAGVKSSKMALVQIGQRLMFLCMGRDTAEFTAEQKKSGEKCLVCTKFKMESNLYSVVRKNNQGIWGWRKGNRKSDSQRLIRLKERASVPCSVMDLSSGLWTNGISLCALFPAWSVKIGALPCHLGHGEDSWKEEWRAQTL